MKIALVLPLFLAGPAVAQIRFTEIQTLDLSATANPAGAHYIGTHPASIAWSGNYELYVAGSNEGGGTGVGFLKVGYDTGSPVYSPVLKFVSGTPAGFGYTGICTSSGAVVAAYDAGAEHPEGLQCLSTFDHSPFWSLNARGSSGVAIESEHSGVLLGAAWLTLGSDRRALQDLASGATDYSHLDGMLVNPGGSASWRDISLDWVRGDYYARKGNDVVKIARTGLNTGTPSVLVDLVDADAVPGQNVEKFDLGLAGLVVYNDRASSAPGQSFFDVVRVATDTGTPLVIDWGTYAPPTGNGRYDFSFAAASETRVAILDCANRRLTIFRVELLPDAVPICFGDGSGTACPCGNHGAPGNGCANSVNANGAHLSVSGVSSLTADSLVLQGSGMPSSSALYFQGTNSIAWGAGSVFGDGLRCAGGAVIRLRTVENVGGASQYPRPGDPSITSSIPWVGPSTNIYQVWYRNAASFCTSSTFNLTNAVVVWWGP